MTRRFGWDCHGLPVEYEIDKKLSECPVRVAAAGGAAPVPWPRPRRLLQGNRILKSILMRFCPCSGPAAAPGGAVPCPPLPSRSSPPPPHPRTLTLTTPPSSPPSPDIKSRQEVLDMGIGRYNEECRSIVMRYSKEWEAIVHRLGRWIDFEVGGVGGAGVGAGAGAGWGRLSG